MSGKCEHGLTTSVCFVCASPKYPAPLICPVCECPIDFKHHATAVMINAWDSALGRYIATGPYHEDCRP